jgi:hypothetical protein
MADLLKSGFYQTRPTVQQVPGTVRRYAGSRISELFIDPFARKDLQPTQGYLAIGPCFHYIRAIPENDVEVVRHDGVGKNVDPEYGG